MPTMELYIGQADLLRQDLARIALQIEESARAVDDSRRLPIDLAARIKEIDGHIKQIELEISAEVQTETVEFTSKLRYPNEDARKAETAKRLRNHTEMPEHLQIRRELEIEKASADWRLASATDALKAYTTVSQLRSNEVILLAAQIQAVASAGDTLAALEKFLVGRIGESFRSGKLGTMMDERVTQAVQKLPVSSAELAAMKAQMEAQVAELRAQQQAIMDSTKA